MLVYHVALCLTIMFSHSDRTPINGGQRVHEIQGHSRHRTSIVNCILNRQKISVQNHKIYMPFTSKILHADSQVSIFYLKHDSQTQVNKHYSVTTESSVKVKTGEMSSENITRNVREKLSRIS